MTRLMVQVLIFIRMKLSMKETGFGIPKKVMVLRLGLMELNI